MKQNRMVKDSTFTFFQLKSVQDYFVSYFPSLASTVTFLKALLMEPQEKRSRVDDGGQNEVGEELDLAAELEESIRIALLSALPLLEAKVKLFVDKKENRMKEKVENLRNQLIEKDKENDDLSATNEDLTILLRSSKTEIGTLKTQNSRTRENHRRQVHNLKVDIL